MKIFNKLLSLLLLLAIAVSLVACSGKGGGETPPGGDTGPGEFIDYTAQLKFDPASGRAYTEATLKLHIDGDTTHFYVPTSVSSTGVLKARYLAINTPESTGQIEAWGKKASDYTKNVVTNATSIIIESDTAAWDLDSTGDRHLVWVWYKTEGMTEYRNLNLEILQAGLSVGSNSADNSYGNTCSKALNQAMAHKLYVHSKTKDPDFYYGSALPLTLKELKTNIDTYLNKKVSFEGVVVRNVDNTAYIEEYDEETGLYFGMQVYYHYNLDYYGLQILNVGNRVRIVGNVQYYEAGGTYQVADIHYHSMRPNHEDNIKLIEEGHSASYQSILPSDLLNGTVSIEITKTDEEGNETLEQKSFDIGFLTMHSSLTLMDLTVVSTYTTSNEDSSNKGAISITCTDRNGTEIVVRTAVLYDAGGNLILAEDYFEPGTEFSAIGIVDCYNGEYQLKVFSIKDFNFATN